MAGKMDGKSFRATEKCGRGIGAFSPSTESARVVVEEGGLEKLALVIEMIRQDEPFGVPAEMFPAPALRPSEQETPRKHPFLLIVADSSEPKSEAVKPWLAYHSCGRHHFNSTSRSRRNRMAWSFWVLPELVVREGSLPIRRAWIAPAKFWRVEPNRLSTRPAQRGEGAANFEKIIRARAQLGEIMADTSGTAA